MRLDARLLACAGTCLACGFQESRPLAPEEALRTFRLADGFRIELFAAEPHVVDPVEMAFDEDGGVYVAELRDNPDDPPDGARPLSRIKYLEDTDGDGLIDRHVVFADGLLAVEGIAPWKGGLIATAAPDILYLKDLDGDRKADVREVLYTGFALAHVEGRLSNPRFGLDNWFYVVNHSQPGEVVSPKRPQATPIGVRNREFRFDPLRGRAEASPGDAQFGHTYNQWGHWFISHNTVHLRHTVMPPGYLRRNPFLTVENAEQDISDHGRPAAPVYGISEPQQWRIDRTAVRQERYAETQPGRVERLAGYFTASCGATVYLGDAFPAGFAGRVFVGEGNGNLVHCDIVSPSGATYAASRWPATSEFLASTDNWFRPVNFANAPDGNLYVIDYYRQYLEHPMFIPEAVKERLDMDFRAGERLGRIYRIVPEGQGKRRSLRAALGSSPSEELVGLLEHGNGWHRRTAHRLLVERQDQAAAPLLRRLAAEGDQPTARLHALWVLAGIGRADADLVEKALSDGHPAVRENALKLAEAHLPALQRSVLAATRDASPRVAFQAALTAGNLPRSAPVIEALGQVLAEYPDDPWFRIAALSAPPEFAESLLGELRRRGRFFETPSESRQATLGGLARILAGRRRPREVGQFLRALVTDRQFRQPAWRTAALRGLAEGLALHRGGRISNPDAGQALQVLLGDASESVRWAAADLARHFELGAYLRQTAAVAADSRSTVDRRILAVRSLQGGSFQEVGETLATILRRAAEPELRTAAAISLATFDESSVGEALIEGWATYTPSTRAAIAELLIRRRGRAAAFADAIVDGRIEPLDIPAVTRIRFAQHPDERVRTRVADLLQLGGGSRDLVVQEHLGVLELPGAPEAGKTVFERECASCHLRNDTRGRIGPDLSGVNNRSKETLLTSILDPSYAIEDRYRNHLLETKDGAFHDGILVAETSATVTLRGEAEDVTVLKSDIADLRQSDVSLMPEGLEDAVSDQELADLIAYLQAGL